MLIALLLLYTGLLVLYPDLSPSDEYAFLPTLQSGKPFPLYGSDFPYYDSVKLGRFSPLGAQEYNLVALFSNSPLAYFAFNALLLIGFTLIFVAILRRLLPDRSYLYAIPIILLLTPGFTLSFFKLLYSEKSVLFYFSVFLISFLAFLKEEKPTYFIATLIGANAAIYYKETAFLAIGAFAFVHMLSTWRVASLRTKVLDGLLMGSALAYIAIYALTIIPHVESQQAYLTQGGSVVFFKNILNYSLYSDPIVVFLFFPLAIWRVYVVLMHGMQAAQPIYDSMLAAGTVYALAYLVLNMYSPYYFLPVYVFALPPLFYFLTREKMRAVIWKLAVGVTGFIFIVNATPLAVHYLAYNKYLPINFNKTVDFLVKDINTRYTSQRINIFFDGVDRGAGRGVYFIAGEFLKFKGLAIEKYDFKSQYPADGLSLFIGRRSPFDGDEDITRLNGLYHFTYPDFPFTVFQPGPASEIKKGDYLIVSPQSTKRFDGDYLHNLKKDYELVFQTHSRLAVPSIDLKTLAKYWISRQLTVEQKAKGIIVNDNLWRWPDYYVFIRR